MGACSNVIAGERGRTKMTKINRLNGKGWFGFVALVWLGACQSGGDELEKRNSALTSADVLGFESVSQWRLTQGVAQSLTASDLRTQGAAALAVTKPSGYVRIDSSNLPSTDAQLGKLDRGTSLALDVRLPPEQANPFWLGAVQVYITVPSLNYFNAYIGQDELTGLRTGVYTTLRFKIPDAVADTLKGKTFSDLSFGIGLNVPTNSPGVYRFDNLRVKGKKAPLPTNENQITPGASILLVASKSYAPASTTVASQNFAQGIVQVPASFHTVTGAAGAGSATFEVKLGTAAPVVCTYPANTSTGHDYAFGSCANGALAGDLVPADFVRLTIVNGDPTAGTTKVRAQIALNPIDDDLLPGLPPIPTFFGTTAADVQASLNAFVQAQRNWQISDSVQLHLPTPAIPVQDSVIRNGTALPPTRASNTDPQYGISGRLTGSDLADAGWHANGGMDAQVDARGARATTFDFDAGAEVFVLGLEQSIVDIHGHTQTNSAAPSNGTIPPTTGSAHFCYSYFGINEVCKDFNDTTGLNQPLFDPIGPHFMIPSINYWIFTIDASADLALQATLSGNFSPSGFSVSVTPSASISATLRGGLSAAGFVGAGLFVTANLIGISVPITATVSATATLQPGACSVRVDEGLLAQAVVTAGGGTIGYYVEAGICCGCFFEICWRDDGDIFTWGGYNQTFDILPATPLAHQTIPLDTASICPPVSNAPGQITYPTDGETFHQEDFSFLEASFQIPFNSGSGTQNLPLDHLVWTSDCATDSISINATHSPISQIIYGDCPTRHISVVATSSSHPEAGTGTGTITVNVAASDQTTIGLVAIIQPPYGQVFPANTCPSFTFNADAFARDLKSQTATVTWFTDSIPRPVLDPYTDSGSEVGTGNNPSVTVSPGDDLIRILAVQPSGQTSLMEIPIDVPNGCIN
jgi:hypothetical protein